MTREQVGTLGFADVLHHYGNETSESRIDYAVKQRDELSKKGTHKVIELKNGEPVYGRNGVPVTRDVTGSKFAEEFARDYDKVSDIMKEMEKDVRAKDGNEKLSNIDAVHEFFLDKELMEKYATKLNELNPEASRFLLEHINKGLFVKSLFDTFIKETKPNYTQGRIATLFIADALKSEDGSFSINDFDKKLGGSIS